MELSFIGDKTSEISFKMGIAGTQTAPSSVAVTLERDNTSLSYSAIKRGDDWVATISNPSAIFGAGEVKMSINVLLNNRLFTPMKSTAVIVLDTATQSPEVVSTVAQEIPVQAPVEVVAQEIPVQAPVEIAPEVVAQVVANENVELPTTKENTETDKITSEKIKLAPQKTEEEKIQEVKTLLKRAKEEYHKNNKSSPKTPSGILKTITPIVEVKSAPIVKKVSVKPKEKKPLFSIKKTKVIYK